MGKQLKKCLILFIFIINAPSVFAHGGKIEISNKPHGPVHISKEQANMIDLKVAAADSRPLAQLLGLNGEIQLLPNAQADVSVRISGSVTELYANLGDNVKVGQRLAKIQSRLVGDPPPSVVINAAIQGVIDARNVDLGQAVEPNTVLFHISDRTQVLVIAHIYEEDLGKIKVGQDANVHVISYPRKVFAGKVILIEPNLDPLTRTVNVRIALNNTEGLLKPGMFARANVILQKNDTALTVPNAAILDANNERFVFLREGDNYNRVVIKTGTSDDDYTEILDGLVPGDEVVTQGNRELYTLWLTGSQASSGAD
ncbi:MAG: efflux RND transporter periplasmic adaptor subunit [Gammaproteobacteria bacterium]